MNRLSRGSQKFHKRGGGLCWYCGVRVALDPRAKDGANRLATVDHQTPLTRGGDDSPENRVTACFRCNQEKANMTVEEYRALKGGVTFHGESS
jgi:5-methylcytosine-specific restriction endonuclease McrA